MENLKKENVRQGIFRRISRPQEKFSRISRNRRVKNQETENNSQNIKKILWRTLKMKIFGEESFGEFHDPKRRSQEIQEIKELKNQETKNNSQNIKKTLWRTLERKMFGEESFGEFHDPKRSSREIRETEGFPLKNQESESNSFENETTRNQSLNSRTQGLKKSTNLEIKRYGGRFQPETLGETTCTRTREVRPAEIGRASCRERV